MSKLLSQSFYARDARIVAQELLGQHIHHGEVVLRISEVEAYCWPDDSANHCRMGRTTRNAPMWGAAGHAYVYLCYGMHHMLNIVTDRKDEGAAVLIRACEPVAGIETVLARRKHKHAPSLLTGPGKVAQALALDTRFSGHCLFRKGELAVHEGDAPEAIVRGPRVGIAYATPEHQRAPWRFAIAGSAWVSERKQLR